MANPFKYVRGFSFSGWQATRPTKPLPGPNVDDELSKVSQSIGQVVDAIADVRRADGKLKNQIVTVDSLASDLSLGLRTPTRWMPSTGYLTLDTVFVDLEGYYGIYRCQKAHTSGASFPADLAAGQWEVIFSLLDLIDQITPAQAIPYVYELADGTPQINLSAIPGAPNITVSRFVLNGAEQVRGTDKDWYMDGATTLRLVSPIALDDLGLTSPATATVYVTPEGPLLDRFDERFIRNSTEGFDVLNLRYAQKNQLGSDIGIDWKAFEQRILATKTQGSGVEQPLLDIQVNGHSGAGTDAGAVSVLYRAQPGQAYGGATLGVVVENRTNAYAGSGAQTAFAPYVQQYSPNGMPAWAIAAEIKEMWNTGNPVNAGPVIEAGYFATGTDNNNKRNALFVPLNNTGGMSGDAEFYAAVWVNATEGTYAKNGAMFKGKFGHVIQAENVSTGRVLTASGQAFGHVIDLHAIQSAFNVGLALNNQDGVSWRGLDDIEFARLRYDTAGGYVSVAGAPVNVESGGYLIGGQPVLTGRLTPISDALTTDQKVTALLTKLRDINLLAM